MHTSKYALYLRDEKKYFNPNQREWDSESFPREFHLMPTQMAIYYITKIIDKPLVEIDVELYDITLNSTVRADLYIEKNDEWRINIF